MIRGEKPRPGAEDADPPGRRPAPTIGSEEWGERVETGRQIARGGTDRGCPPGATGGEPRDPRSGQDRCDRP